MQSIETNTPSSRNWYQALLPYFGMSAVLGLLVLVFGIGSNNFLSLATLSSVANRIPDLTVIAVGMTLVLVAGGIDLSVGSLLAFSSAVLGVLMVDWGWPLAVAMLACVLASGLAGALSGIITVLAGIPSFIVTLGMLEIARGAAYLLTDSQTRYIGSSVEWIGAPLGAWFVSPAFLMALAVVAGGQFLLTRTVFGRYCVALGTNNEAVRMSGIRTWPYTVAVFALSGLLCGLAGIMQTSRLSSADPNAAVGLELNAIAACVIGGTSLLGGRGSVVHTFFGVLIIEVLQTGLAQVGATDPTKRIVTGVVIITAVVVDAAKRWLHAGRP